MTLNSFRFGSGSDLLAHITLLSIVTEPAPLSQGLVFHFLTLHPIEHCTGPSNPLYRTEGKQAGI